MNEQYNTLKKLIEEGKYVEAGQLSIKNPELKENLPKDYLIKLTNFYEERSIEVTSLLKETLSNSEKIVSIDKKNSDLIKILKEIAPNTGMVVG